MKFISQAEGYIEPDGAGGYEYVYQYKDHLGNIRLNYSDSNSDGVVDSSEIIEENNYYPFGLLHRGYNSQVTGTQYPFMFGSNEYDESLEINSYDFGERNYSPDLGRWMNLDPLAEFMRNQSPYNFGFNNPIYFSDYGGTIPWPLPECFKIWRRKSKPDEYFGFIKSRGRNHYGLDLNYSGGGNTDLGAPVVATHSGRVAKIVPIDANDGGGRIVVIESPDRSFQTKYMHLSAVTVQPGDEIDEGQTIGLMGGSAFGKELGRKVHLHYEIHRNTGNGMQAVNPWGNGAPIDPQRWIPTMGPHLEASMYDFGFAEFMPPFMTAEQIAAANPSKGVVPYVPSGSREPINPIPVTPMPITPLPITPPTIGPIIIPPPSTPPPGGEPIIIPPRLPDSGF